ncbi:MAG: VWA domain-containing protein [Scytonematopsis contorta HA4267-MV1]|jgi:Mg-chelatase subunit ChlD|nr:VWA domain-containing protein [Scytonematopsis contorta HA4267-MV1]
MTQTPEENLRRWRLILGNEQADGTDQELNKADSGVDKALNTLYENEQAGGLSSSSPKVAQWLDDIRNYFPTSVVKVMQKDALERIKLRELLLEPEILQAIEPDVHLVANLLSLKHVMPEKTLTTARQVVRSVVEEIQRKLANQTRSVVMGSLNRQSRNNNPRHNEIDWNRTIRANLKHYQPNYRTIIPEVRIGYRRKRSALRNIILCIDQSASMATSVVYGGIFAAVLASLPAIKTHIVVFDTAVVDLTNEAQDAVDLLFGTQLGGGTDINRALLYCQEFIQQPQDTIFILISDLYEGGNREELVKRVAKIVNSGVEFIALLALNDEGAPIYDRYIAQALADLGINAFACTPDKFPDLIAAAIGKRGVGSRLG